MERHSLNIVMAKIAIMISMFRFSMIFYLPYHSIGFKVACAKSMPDALIVLLLHISSKDISMEANASKRFAALWAKPRDCI